MLISAVLACSALADRSEINFNRNWQFSRPESTVSGEPLFKPLAVDLAAQGTFPKGTAAQVVRFDQRTARYVCFEALSSYQGPFASVAELELLDEQGKPVSRQDWQLLYRSSEEAGSEELAANAIDGNPATQWHSQWRDAQPAPPHALVFDLGAPTRFAALRYLPRQDGNSSGMTREWRFYARSAPFELPKPIATAEIPADAKWESVCLPHSVRLEIRNASGGRNYQGVCWYRKTFAGQAGWSGRRVRLAFEGAMQVADLWLNGRKLMKHYGGYLPFTVDITDAVRRDGDNELVIRLNNADNPEVPPGTPQSRLDFTYFGGLYRNVKLVVLEPMHITDEYLADKPAGGGIFVRYPAVAADKAVVEVQTDITNGCPSARQWQLKQELLDAGGAVIATDARTGSLAGGGNEAFTQSLNVANPKLWHPDHPNLYTLRTTLVADGSIVDHRTTRIGIRRIEFKVDGLYINGAKHFASGFNRHQDHPYVGYALPDSAHWRDAKKMREAGLTSFRSHYPQSPAWMDACDEFGILCIVSNPGWQFYGNRTWEARLFQNAREMVRRDRNHPSAILYEPFPNETGYSDQAARTLNEIVHAEYPGDQCFTAGEAAGGHVKFLDVTWGREQAYDKPFWGREWGDSVDNWGDQQGRVRVARGWGEGPLLTQALNHAIKLDAMLKGTGGGPAVTRMAGAGVWAGIDCYRGYHQQPFLGGSLDLFRLPKFDYYFFQSQRDPATILPGADPGPMVFIANYATAYSPVLVTVFSNCEQVRFYENGRLVATQSPDAGYVLAHPPFSFKAKAEKVEKSTYNMTTDIAANSEAGYHYEPAAYKAEGLIGGKVVATHTVQAPGVMRQIVLEADLCGRNLEADGADWVRVYAKICDSHGTVHPFADDLVTFSVEGEGMVIGDAAIEANPVHAEAGIATALIRSTSKPGRLTVRADAPGLKSGVVTFQSVKE
jgi:beta-galactosidase